MKIVQPPSLLIFVTCKRLNETENGGGVTVLTEQYMKVSLIAQILHCAIF